MHTFQKIAKPISILAVILFLLMSTLNQLAEAAMVGTEKLLISDRNQETRSYLQQMMSRKEIQEALVARGIDLQEAKIRIDSLTDREIEQILEKINDLPAGGIDAAFVLIIVGVIIVLFIIVEYTSAVPMFSWFQSGKWLYLGWSTYTLRSDILQLVGFPEHAVAVHAQLTFVLSHEIDSDHDIRPGTFGEQRGDLGDKDTVLEHWNPAVGAFQGMDVPAVRYSIFCGSLFSPAAKAANLILNKPCHFGVVSYELFILDVRDNTNKSQALRAHQWINIIYPAQWGSLWEI